MTRHFSLSPLFLHRIAMIQAEGEKEEKGEKYKWGTEMREETALIHTNGERRRGGIKWLICSEATAGGVHTGREREA